MMFRSRLIRLRHLMGVPRQTVLLTAKIDNARAEILNIAGALHELGAVEDERAHRGRKAARRARDSPLGQHDPGLVLQAVQDIAARHFDQAADRAAATAALLDEVTTRLEAVVMAMRDR